MSDIIFYNAHIYTMASPGERAEAIAIRGNRIEALGHDRDILALAGENTRLIDLQGKCVLPGFNDSHCHVALTGLELQKVPLRHLNSIDEIIEVMREHIRVNHIPEGQWVVGGSYDHLRFDHPRHPNRYDLDKISTRHPILVERFCGHVGAANTLALQTVGFDEHTVIEGEGGILEKGEDGRLTGVLVETARDVLARRMPKRSAEEVAGLIRPVFEQAAAFGVTSMQTDDVEAAPIGEIMAAYRLLARRGEACVRIWEEVQAPRLKELREFLSLGMRTGDGDDLFKIGNIKLITDGSLGARTAYMSAPYGDDPLTRGVSVYTPGDLEAIVSEAHRAGMQVACHAIGDAAVAQCVRAMIRARAQDGRDLRDRIVHCQFADDATLDDMAAHGICADIQPPFVAQDWRIAQARLGARCRMGYRWAGMARRGINMGGGSDSPVETFNPIWGIHCAVNRTDGESLPEGGWRPEERLSVYEAVRLYTAGGACLTFEEAQKGLLKPGMLADMAILNRDIFQVKKGEIKDLRNVMTVMDGRVVYQARGE